MATGQEKYLHSHLVSLNDIYYQLNQHKTRLEEALHRLSGDEGTENSDSQSGKGTPNGVYPGIIEVTNDIRVLQQLTEKLISELEEYV